MKTTCLSWATSVLGALLVLFATSGWSAQTQVLPGHVPAIVKSLTPLGRLPGTNRMSMAIGLPLRNQAALSNLLQQIYDPTSPNYRHYLTPDEFTAQFGPTEEDYQKVIQFAQASGLTVTKTHGNRMLVDVAGNIPDVEKAFHVTMRTYRHPAEARDFFAPDVEPTVDSSVPVLHISGLDNYALPKPLLHKMPASLAKPASGSGLSGSYIGNDFRNAYVPGTPLNGSGQMVGLLQFDSGFYQSDINGYESLAGLPNVPVQAVLIDGYGGGPGMANDEVSLDIEMVIAMAPGVSNIYVFEGDIADDILNAMAASNQVKQLSASWSYPIDPTSEQIFQQFAAQGQSFFNASGDNDAWLAGQIPTPCDDPYITIVGGTTLSTANNAWTSETVWNWGTELGEDGIGSSGGISTTYTIPGWQTNINMTSNQGSTTYRNIPDVALTGDNVFVEFGGGSQGIYGGTSCATPLWAGFMALVNQQAAARGKPTIGFANPAIYAIAKGANYASAFHDITTGNNTWSSSPSRFYAVSGYDLCTGWGTPAGQSLINALVNPEALLITPPTGFTSMGGFGGPFTITSQNFSLTNTGTGSLTWKLANTSAWLNVSSTGGTLAPGGPAATVTVSLNTAASNLVVGTYNATVWFTNLNDNVGQGRQFTVSVISAPVITLQPSNQVVLQGATAAFNVAATGGLPLSYQWRDNGTNLTDGGNIFGSMTTNLVISNVSTNNLGTYTVIVTNVAGSVTSSNAILTITSSPPVIVLQPTNQTVIVGGTAAFSVTANGSTPLSYQWGFNGTNIAGATNTTLTMANVQLNQAGNYAVLVTNLYGSVLSSNALLTVNPAPTNVPVIVSFSPQSGADGTVVNITGLNFDPVPGNNKVHFGAVQAVVTAASATNLVVNVPVGATYAPITETVNGLTAYANAPFLPTFLSSGVLANSSLGPQITLPTGGGASAMVIADFDGDGKPDLAVPCGSDHTIYIYRNISTNGTLTAGSFAPPVVLQLGTGGEEAMVAADMTGDGRPDLVLLDYNANQVMVFQNFCTPGSITTNSFGPRVNFAVGSNPLGVAVRDLDGDGKPEIITANTGNSSISVLRNIGTTGTITTNSFAPAVNFVGATGTHSVAIADMDEDGKPDVVAVNLVNGNNNAVSVFRNVSTLGNIAFATRIDFPGPIYSYKLAIGDMDGDGKLDVVFASFANGQSVSVYRNTSTPGSITFAPRIDFGLGGWGNGVALGDLDGSGKPDVAAVTQISSQLSLFRNISTPGSFTNSSLGARLDFASGTNPYGVAIGDLDGDGRPDIVFANNSSSTISIYQNVVPAQPFITTQPFSSTNVVGTTASFTVAAGGSPPLTYQWKKNGVNIAGATSTNFTIISVQTSDAATYSVAVTNAFGSVISSNALLIVLSPPIITLQPAGRTNLAGTTAAFTNAASGTLPLNYQWRKNGSNMTDGGNVSGSATNILTLSNVSDADAASYTVVVTNVFGSVTSSPAVLVLLDPPVILSQPTNLTVIRSSNATFSVTAAGSAPLIYQWNFNGTNILAATNTSFSLTNAQLSGAGNYAVLVTNAYGSVLSSNAILVVNPLFHFIWSQIPSPRFVNTPFAVVVQAQNTTNGMATNFTSAVTLLSTNGVPVNPVVSGNFIQGVWTGAVTVAQTATNLVLQASDSFGESGLANPINVISLPTLTTVPSGSTLYIFWPVDPSGFVLESTAGLSPANWVPVTTQPFPIGNQYLVPIQMSGTNAFYRLHFNGP